MNFRREKTHSRRIPRGCSFFCGNTTYTPLKLDYSPGSYYFKGNYNYSGRCPRESQGESKIPGTLPQTRKYPIFESRERPGVSRARYPRNKKSRGTPADKKDPIFESRERRGVSRERYPRNEKSRGTPADEKDPSFESRERRRVSRERYPRNEKPRGTPAD